METIGKYQIEKKIGGGGFGEVFKAYDPFIKRHVAIKTCNADDQNVARRFYKEAEIGGNLHHRNITTVYDFGLHEGLPYLIQEYLSGEDLDVKIKRRDYLPYTEKLLYLLQIARGLAYAHSKGYIHRDVKPANIRILEDGTAKIMDFGIARLAQGESGLTETGMTVGTAAYLSPEQVRGDSLDLRTDIFSFGILAYELLTYERPFHGDQISTVIYNLLNREPEPITAHWPGAPPKLVALVDRCLRKDAGQRFVDGSDLVRELETLKRLGRGGRPSETPMTRQVRTPAPSPAAPPAAPPAPSPTVVAELDGGHPTPAAARGASGLEYDRLPEPTQTTGHYAAKAGGAPRSNALSLAILLILAAGAGAGGWWLGMRDQSADVAGTLLAEPSQADEAFDSAPPEPDHQPDNVEPGHDASDHADSEPPPATSATGSPETAPVPESSTPPPPAPTTGRLILPRVPWTDRMTARVGTRSYGLHRRHTLELPPGTYRVVFALAAGAAPETGRPASRSLEVQVTAGQSSPSEVPIPERGAISVRPLPGRSQGQVSIDGEPLGSTPLDRIQREPGAYTLEILPRDGDGEGLRQEITLEAGHETIISFDLDQGTLRTTAKASAAKG